MLFGEILSVALSAIRANKLRSILTMLGIVIGVSAVITMVALGSGAQKQVSDQIASLGTNLLSVFPGQMMFGGVGEQRVNMKVDDALALKNEARTLSNVVPELQRNMQVKYTNKNGNISIIGTFPNYAEVNNYKIDAGRMFTVGEDESRKRVAVLFGGIPTMFNANPAAMIGQDVQIGGIAYEIVGVLAAKGSTGGFGGNQDERILIPLWTARYRAFGTDRIGSVTVQVRNADSVQLAMLEIERILRREHRIVPGGANDFSIRNRQDFLTALTETTKTFTFLLGGIAAVSLLVGGIGIMNIMLVSVTERTKEIGTRKALGATRGNILLQFLIEAVVLCMLGGIVGIMLGSGGALALAKLAKWNTVISPASVFLAFGFSAAVGVIFGLWPARRAAIMDPITALRYE